MINFILNSVSLKQRIALLNLAKDISSKILHTLALQLKTLLKDTSNKNVFIPISLSGKETQISQATEAGWNLI